MTFPAFLDTCALHGAYLCDTFLRLAESGTFRPLWSASVLDELKRSLVRRGIPEEAAQHRIAAMRGSFPDAEVIGYESLVSGMANDEKDRHVLAAAVRAKADVIVTFNARDFPDEACRPYEISVVGPDDFLLDQLDLYPAKTLRAIECQVGSYSRPPTTVRDLLPLLTRSGVPRFADEVRRHLRS